VFEDLTMAAVADPMAVIEAAIKGGTRSVPRQQLADMLGVSLDTVARWPLPPIRLGRLVYFDLRDVLTFLGRKSHEFRMPGRRRRADGEARKILKREGYDV
jgi:phage terminase Nu1 subunit (DNA packaging protein)